MKNQPIFTRTGFSAFLLLILILSLIFLQAGPSALAAPLPAALKQASVEPSVEVDLLSGEKTIRFPANALNFDKTSTILTQYGTGIRWQANFANAAFLTVPRPLDWDGVSDVTLSLYFTPMTSASGNVQFFIRPRAFNPGDSFADAIDLSGDAVAVSGANQVREQVFTIPAARFGAKELWVISIQRGGALETYDGDVVLMAVGLSYTQPVQRVFLPVINE